MANELQTTAQGDALTVYAIIRRRSDLLVWSTVAIAFVAWVDADVANYDVPMASFGGDLYAGDFPTGIAAGTVVRVNFYSRAGGTPAISDLNLGGREFNWSGVSLGSVGGSVGAVGCQLTDLDTVKRFIEIADTAKDDLLQQIINQQSARVHRLIGRSLCASDYVEFQRYDSGGCLVLRNWPVVYVSRVAYGAGPAIDLSYVGTAVRALASVTDDAVRLTSTTPGGVTTTTVLSFSVYPTLSMLATVIDGVSGWSAQLSNANQDGLASNLNRLSGLSAKATVEANRVSLTFPDQSWDGYEVRQDSAIVKLGCRERGCYSDELWWGGRSCSSVMVEYRAGYETIPQDVSQVVMEMVSDSLAATGDRSASGGQAFKSENIGDYSYTRADVGSTEAMSERHMALLSPYMTARVGSVC